LRYVRGMVRRSFIMFLALLAVGCSTRRLSGADLDRTRRPAFISRIEIEAGPHSFVFREDGTYKEKLKKLEPREADRRLQAKLEAAMTRFEISERLRVYTLSQLPQERPWVNTLNAAHVASVLESYLVQEVPANAPDYDLLTPLGPDTVVEFVIESYGMRSKGGRAGVFIRGYGRMFRLSNRSEVWRRPFHVDRVREDTPHLDPFKVGKQPQLFRQELRSALDVIVARFVEDLNPEDRTGGPPPLDDAEPASVPRTGRGAPPPRAPDDLPPGELPDPD
jgi:hypothetical protein